MVLMCWKQHAFLAGGLLLLMLVITSGFAIVRQSIHPYWIWAYYIRWACCKSNAGEGVTLQVSSVYTTAPSASGIAALIRLRHVLLHPCRGIVLDSR